MEKTDDAGLVDEVGDAAAAIQLSNYAVIGNQGKTQTELLNKVEMGLQCVGTDAQDLSVELFKTREIVLKSLHFAGSAGGEICIVQGQDNRPFLNNQAEFNLAFG